MAMEGYNFSAELKSNNLTGSLSALWASPFTMLGDLPSILSFGAIEWFDDWLQRYTYNMGYTSTIPFYLAKGVGDTLKLQYVINHHVVEGKKLVPTPPSTMPLANIG